jgi:eukaryotic-like serine/threonine-protein kinase
MKSRSQNGRTLLPSPATPRREVKAEQAAVVNLQSKEKKANIAKYIVGGAIAIALVGAGGAWFLQKRAERQAANDTLDDGPGTDLSGGAGLTGGKRAQAGGGGKGRRGGGAGGAAGGGGGGSFESAQDNYNEEIKMGGPAGQPDLTQAQLGAPLNGGGVVTGCGTPGDMKVVIQVAVQNGHAVGVTVTTNPSNPGISACIAGRVRGLSWPSHPKRDFVTSRF